MKAKRKKYFWGKDCTDKKNVSECVIEVTNS